MKKGHKTKNYNQDLELEQMFNNQSSVSTNILNFKLDYKFKNVKQKDLYNTIMTNRITFVNGSSGTGKTFVALLAGLELIKDLDKNIGQMTIVKPLVEITTTKGIGALPGDLGEKTLNYFAHFHDNLEKLIGKYAATNLKNGNMIRENVLNYMRGTTFGQTTADGTAIGSYVILDEAQNTSIHEIKTFISRMGENSKLVILGDIDQIDMKLAPGEKCGLEDAIERLKDINGIGMVEFTEEDIVRDPFLIEIMKRYKIK